MPKPLALELSLSPNEGELPPEGIALGDVRDDSGIEVQSVPALPALTGAAVLTAPDALKARLETYSASRKILMEWIEKELVPGTDYQLIHRKVGDRGNKRACPQQNDSRSKRCHTCGGKATLCKPGAEKICGLLRLRPKFRQDHETWEMLGKAAGTLALVCELVSEDGSIVAEGRGCRTKEQDFGDVNKSVKMCAKSAQIDAVLRCAGLSEVFTQDLEEGHPDDKEPKKPPAKVQPPRAPFPTEPTLSHDQIAEIDGLIIDAGKSVAWLLSKVGYGKTLEDVRASDYARVKDYFDRWAKAHK